MRPMLAVSAGVSLLLLAAGAGWAGAKGKGDVAESGKDKEPASFNKTFQWEEKVVGPKDKGVDHDKIAAMQEQGRREDAAKRREPPKKAQRTEGVNGPASSVIPTQDIEKPAPPRVQPHAQGVVHAAQAARRDRQRARRERRRRQLGRPGRDGLGKVFGGSSTSRHQRAKHAKHAAAAARSRHARSTRVARRLPRVLRPSRGSRSRCSCRS